MVRERLPRRAEVHVRRVPEEVGDAGGVHVRILLDLPHQMRLIAKAAPGDVAPVLVEVGALLIHHRRDLVVVLHHGGEEVAHAHPHLALCLGREDDRFPVPFVPVKLGAHVVENIPTLLLGLDQRMQLQGVVTPSVHRDDLLLDLAHNQRRPPPHVRLREVNIGEDVVPNVHNVVGTALEQCLHHACAPSGVEAALLHPKLLPHHPVFSNDLVERHSLREERRLARRHNRDIEEIPPGAAFREEPVDHVRHHNLGVFPVRVGDQRQLFPSLLLVHEGLRKIRVILNISVRILHDVRLETALHMRLEKSFTHRVEKRLVGDTHPRLQILEKPRVELLDELGVETALRDREERVQEQPPLLPEVDKLAAVDFVRLAVREPPRPVHRAPHVPEAVDFDHVPQSLVDDEPSADQVRVELHIIHGKPDLHEVLFRVVVGTPLPLDHLVMNQRVVHIVPDTAERAHVEGARTEDRALRLCGEFPRHRRPPVVQPQLFLHAVDIVRRELAAGFHELLAGEEVPAGAFAKVIHRPVLRGRRVERRLCLGLLRGVAGRIDVFRDPVHPHVINPLDQGVLRGVVVARGRGLSEDAGALAPEHSAAILHSS
mmetsp:Transcript_1711/g.4046  ORF Transcript_1711/g.4046 Transcript_1711/m.4046 type:complete len:600 (-) Transcript_1711:517-2316(-)